MAQQPVTVLKSNQNKKACTDTEPQQTPTSRVRLYGDYAEGDIVRIDGLQSKAQWNGQFAKIKQFIPDKQRYHVITTVDPSTDQLKSALLKEENLTLIYEQRQNAVHKVCIVCNAKKAMNEMTDCPFCRSMFYCSSKCKKYHFTEKGHFRFMCSVYKSLAEYEHSMITKTETLFAFKNMVKEDHRMWLMKYGLLDKGIWKRLWWNQQCPFIPYGDLILNTGINKKGSFAFWALGSGKDMKHQLEQLGDRYIPVFNDPEHRFCINKGSKNKIIKNWRAYHKLKGITLKSPVSQFMSYVMTVYYGLTKYLGFEPQFEAKKEITVHLVGAEIEFDLKHLFCEILCILPGFDVTIYMVGMGDSEALISKQMQKETMYKVPSSQNVLKVVALRMEYSRENVKKSIVKSHQIPDLLVALNAGFEGYRDEWGKAMRWIVRKQIPSLFTEYTITTVQSAEVHLKEWFGENAKFDEMYKCNPFRSSMISFNAVSRYCSIQNAWIYTMFTKNAKCRKHAL